jgi:RNA polymerase sigma-70 factor (ECF subfamily)
MSDTEHPGESHHRFRLLKGGKPVDEKRDDELLRAFLVGDEEALGELFERHQHTVYAIVRRYARSADDARDLTQRAFLRVLEAGRRTVGRTRGRKVIPFRPWLLRIAVNLGKNQVRDAARWRKAPLEAIDHAHSTEPHPADALERAERERMVRAAVVRLPKRQREVLTLRIDAELSFLEIASVLRITENNAKVHFHQAAKRLRAMVSEPEESAS